ncbi:extracellular solute-binding protein [Pseudonocardia sp. TRM90224]|uniref:extracellular solute-binding protein n=1 Tax=Pseudonocardia sp. TRM90224 TaxID=2812678 RepID=UPI001E492EF9|nr:extracellular solute-binding protein [Pseudonocardia sp. TRM90224]
MGLDGEAGSISRRSVLLGLLGAGALSACGGVPAAQELRFWHLMTGGDGKIMQKMQAAAAASTGVRINTTVLAWGALYYTKLAMASAGGRAPDMAVLHLSRLPGYAPGGLLDAWDVDLLGELGAPLDAFPQSVLRSSQQAGELFALPLDTHPFVMFYAPPVLERAGLLGPDRRIVELAGADRFFEALAEVQKVTGSYGAAYGFLSDASQAWRLFWTLYRQTGATMELADAPARMDPDAAARAVDFGKRLFDGTLATGNDSYASAIASFGAGRSGIYFCGEWELVSFQELEMDFDMAPFPTVFDVPAAAADSHVFVLPRRSVVDPAAREATHRYAAALLKESLAWARAGHIPAYQPVTKSAGYADLMPQSHYTAAQDAVALDPQAWFTGAGSTFQTRMSQALSAAWSGGPGTAETVRTLQRELDTFASKPNPA